MAEAARMIAHPMAGVPVRRLHASSWHRGHAKDYSGSKTANIFSHSVCYELKARREAEAPSGATALELLQAVYRNPAVAVASLTGRDLAAALDRAISRSRPVLIEARAVEPAPE
jgi:hypothetical protein